MSDDDFATLRNSCVSDHTFDGYNRGREPPRRSATVVACDCCGSDDWELAIEHEGHRLARCSMCGLYYLLPGGPEGAHTEDAPEFTPEQQLRAERARGREFSDYIELLRAFAPPGAWLDIGCGCGTLAKMMREAGIDASGLELSEGRARLAKQQGVLVYRCPVEDITGVEYAAVSMINVFSHLAAPSETFQAIKRILLPGGVLLIRTGQFGAGLKKRHLPRILLGEERQYLGPETIEIYARRLGFEVVRHDHEAWVDRFMERRLTVPGRSPLRNAIKRAATLPGARLAFRTALKIRYPGPLYVTTVVLRKPI